MTAAEQLRALVKEATPGPWWWDGEFKVHAPCPGRISPWLVAELHNAQYDGRLIVLAPQLAELVADMGEALAKTIYKPEGYSGPDVWWASEANELLARLVALFPEEATT